MSDVKILRAGSIGKGFVPAAYLPPGADEHTLRNRQSGKPSDAWRPLRQKEIETLLRLGSEADDWSTVLVSDPFTPQRVRNCVFHGLVRIGRLEDVVLEHHDLRTPAGLTDSCIVACDIGDDCAIHNVRYLAHYLVGDCVILLNIAEMQVTNHAKFGNGILKDGEEEPVRVWMDLINETGARAVLPFDGMTPADACLWARYRDDPALLARLKDLTQSQCDSQRGYYGTVGDRCIIKNTGVIKDVKIGAGCYIKGANKLKNLTIRSSQEEPTQIGEGVELVNGIIGPGCHVFYGSKAVRFVMGSNCSLKYGARLVHSLLGDNSTVSCCELLNNLIFPAHEQHHNDSFLTASLVMGQSNVAAGATIGSNHNSRANDGEIQAGRGFWPGLCVTLKHPCRFASFTLLAKADYPAELDVPLPFALVANDSSADCLRVIPAYWWMYNMYALARNTWKFQARDKRKTPVQHIEFDFLAPDTIEEILRALELLELWAGRAYGRAKGLPPEGLEGPPKNGVFWYPKALLGPTAEGAGPGPRSADGEDLEALRSIGRMVLRGPDEDRQGLEVLAEGVENSRRKVVVLKAREGYEAYRQMLRCYAMKNLLDWMKANPVATRKDMREALWPGELEPRQGQGEANHSESATRPPGGPPRTLDLARIAKDLECLREVGGRFDQVWAAHPLREWVNLGGQLIPQEGADRLRDDVRTGRLASWAGIHKRYDDLWAAYALQKQRHAMGVLLRLAGGQELVPELWDLILTTAVRDQRYIRDQVFASRKKDYDDPFRRITCRDDGEFRAVFGSVEDNAFVQQVRRETEEFERLVEEVRRRA